MPKLGPYSRVHTLRVIDGRRAEAKLMKAVRDELTQHIGGTATISQRMLIDRAATLSLRLRLLDRLTLSDAGLSEKNAREAVCWENALRRTLTTLGMKAAAQPPPSLQDYLASKRSSS
jgi:hypothetical protein